MGKIIAAVLCAWLLVPAVYAMDVSGKWSGLMELTGPDGQVQSLAEHAEFKQQDTALTGTIGHDGEFAIDKGKAAGKRVEFEVTAPENGENRLYKVTLAVINPTVLEGSVEFEQDGQKKSAKLTLRREK